MRKQVKSRDLVTNINVASNHDLEKYLSDNRCRMFVISYDEVAKHLGDSNDTWDVEGEEMEYVTISYFERGGRRNAQMVFRKLNSSGTYTSTCAVLLEESLLDVMNKSSL